MTVPLFHPRRFGRRSSTTGLHGAANRRLSMLAANGQSLTTGGIIAIRDLSRACSTAIACCHCIALITTCCEATVRQITPRYVAVAGNRRNGSIRHCDPCDRGPPTRPTDRSARHPLKVDAALRRRRSRKTFRNMEEGERDQVVAEIVAGASGPMGEAVKGPAGPARGGRGHRRTRNRRRYAC